MANSKRWTEQVVRGLEDQGARVKRTKSGYMVMFPNGDSATMHLTPSDWRAEKNDRARVRRAGLEWPPDTWGRRK